MAVLCLTAVVGTGSAAAAKAPRAFYGVQPLGVPSTSQAARMASGGIGSPRLPISWHNVQPDPYAPINWTETDSFVAQMAAVGIETFPNLYEAPDSLGGRKSLPVSTAAQRSGWAAFVEAAVRRYGPGGQFWAEHGPSSPVPLPQLPMSTWEIWNEENTVFFTNPPSPRAYAKLLKASRQAIRRADPHARVVVGGLLGGPKKGIKFRGASTAQGFLQRLYEVKGIKSSFDGVALHAYVTTARSLVPYMDQIRSVMAANKDRKASTYLTELGWGSDHADSFGKGPDGQASELRKAYKLLTKNRKRWKLQRTHWFSLTDGVPGICSFCTSHGLFTIGFEPKPAWSAFAAVAGGTP